MSNSYNNLSFFKQGLKQEADHVRQSVSKEREQSSTKQNHNKEIKSELNIDNYLFKSVLGLGSYAVVRQALHMPTNILVAIKTYEKQKLVNYQKKKNVQREIKILSKIRHNNIIRLYSVIETNTQLHLIMEFVQSIPLNLYLKMKQNRRIDENAVKNIFSQLVNGLKYCHKKSVVHRDIKLENILIDQQNKIKLIDFGFSIAIYPTTKLTTFCGTPSYMAPEIVNKKDYNFEVDIWALGIVLYKMLTGIFPFKGKENQELYRKINAGIFDYPNFISNPAKKLINQILKHNPKERLSLEEIQNNEWLVKNVQIKI